MLKERSPSASDKCALLFVAALSSSHLAPEGREREAAVEECQHGLNPTGDRQSIKPGLLFVRLHNDPF